MGWLTFRDIPERSSMARTSSSDEFHYLATGSSSD